MQLPSFYKEAASPKGSNDFPLVIVEFTLLNPASSNYDNIRGTDELSTNRTEHFTDTTLNLVTSNCSLVDLRRNRNR